MCGHRLRPHDAESETTRICHCHPHVKGKRRFREYSLRPEFSKISVLERMRVAEPPQTDRNINVSQISGVVWTQPLIRHWTHLSSSETLGESAQLDLIAVRVYKIRA